MASAGRRRLAPCFLGILLNAFIGKCLPACLPSWLPGCVMVMLLLLLPPPHVVIEKRGIANPELGPFGSDVR